MGHGLAREGRRLCKVYFLLWTLSATCSKAQDWQWVTVLAVSKNNSNTNVYSMLMSEGNFSVHEDKGTLPVETVVANGNYKSSLVDKWPFYNPAKVRVALFNEYGSPMWFSDLNKTYGGKNPRVWMTPSSLAVSTDRKMALWNSELSMVFNHTLLEIRAINGEDARLKMTWEPSPQTILVATDQWGITSPPLCVPEFKSNEQMVMEQASATAQSPFFFSSGNAFGMYLLYPHYLAGMGIRKSSSFGHLHQFSLLIAMDPQCYSPSSSPEKNLYRPVCYNGTNTTILFNASYEYGQDQSLALFVFPTLVSALCIKLMVHNATGDPNITIFLYKTQYAAVEASIFAIQWWMDPETTSTTSADTTTTNGDTVTQPGVCKVVTICESSTSADVTTQTDGTTEAVDVTPLQASEIEKIREEFKKTLGVAKKETTKFKRQFISVPDSRPSAMVIGGVGILFISMVTLCIVVHDFTTLLSQMQMMVSNLKHVWTPKSKAKAKSPMGQCSRNTSAVDVEEFDTGYI